MKVQLLELHLSQLLCAWSKSKHNKYSDKNKNLYHDGLRQLIKKLTDDDFSILPVSELDIRKKIIDFIFKSLEFLNQSTLNEFPIEIVECLNVALKDWLDTDDFIIVTSLNNDLLSYSFDPAIAFDLHLFFIIQNTYGVEFKKKLLQINLPQSLSRDYLANVVLYHELGHFIEIKYQIAKPLAIDIMNRIAAGSILPGELLILKTYFPYIDDFTINFDYRRLQVYVHLREYFSDIFASQYISKCSNYYLEYITNGNTIHNNSHPSTTNRIKLVNDFIENNPNYLISLLNNATLSTTITKSLYIRYVDVNFDEFFKLLPIVIENENQLSSLYIKAWELWNGYNNDFENNNNIVVELKPSKRYEIINNLIEKSISNFIITESWKKI